MNKSFYSVDGQRVGIETEDWSELILRFLENDNYIFMYSAEEPVDIKSVVDISVVPILFYTLIEMSILVDEELSDEVIASELKEVLKERADLDNYGYLSLSFDQVAFIEKYKKEIKAWMPIAIKKHVIPNSKKLKGLFSGNI